MRTVTLITFGWLATTAVASAQSIITTNVERDYQGRISTITSTSRYGTMRSEYVNTGTGSQVTTTYEPTKRGYNPMGQGGYRPLGR